MQRATVHFHLIVRFHRNLEEITEKGRMKALSKACGFTDCCSFPRRWLLNSMEIPDVDFSVALVMKYSRRDEFGPLTNVTVSVKVWPTI